VTRNGGPAGGTEPAEIDTSRAHAARVYDYLLGGRATSGSTGRPPSVPMRPSRAGSTACERRTPAPGALGRVVRHFVWDAGITQFLDIGTGIPRKATCTRWRSGRRPMPASCTSTGTRSCWPMRIRHAGGHYQLHLRRRARPTADRARGGQAPGASLAPSRSCCSVSCTSQRRGRPARPDRRDRCPAAARQRPGADAPGQRPASGGDV
jgi:hypothetical protein